MDVLLIGYGAIAQEVLKHIRPGEDANIAAILVRPGRVDEVRAAVAELGIQVVSSFDELTTTPQLVAECAGHAGVRAYGAAARPAARARGDRAQRRAAARRGR